MATEVTDSSRTFDVELLDVDEVFPGEGHNWHPETPHKTYLRLIEAADRDNQVIVDHLATMLHLLEYGWENPVGAGPLKVAVDLDHCRRFQTQPYDVYTQRFMLEYMRRDDGSIRWAWLVISSGRDFNLLHGDFVVGLANMADQLFNRYHDSALRAGRNPPRMYGEDEGDPLDETVHWAGLAEWLRRADLKLDVQRLFGVDGDIRKAMNGLYPV